ncbi:MAG TPA: hypothetical protein VF079_02025 [Sphingomicrobium sp.]
MSERTINRSDRIAGIALLVLAVATMFVPRFAIAGQPISLSLTGATWFSVAILLLTAHHASRPMPRLTRWVAAIMFALGLAAPFIANLIDSFLGA